MLPVMTSHIVLSVAAVLCILLAIRSIYLQKSIHGQKKQLKSAFDSLENVNKELSELKKTHTSFNAFKDDLNTAHLATNVHKSRDLAVQKRSDYVTPDRYRYVHSLHQKGLKPMDIAAILAISPIEASQLVSLARLNPKD